MSGLDPAQMAALFAAGAALLVLLLLVVAVLRTGAGLRALGDGQQRLAGGLAQVAEAQARAQAEALGLMERRLAEVSAQMGESLGGSTARTARSLGALTERLETIDRAQAKLEKLSGDVLGLQDILSNKQARGAFGEIQLHDIVASALPPDSYQWQATLSNGKRADCLIRLPRPPGPIAVDSKFPLEAYEALRGAVSEEAKAVAERQFRAAVRAHLKAIAGKYIVEGETADGALMFLPSEAVYAELHAHFGDLVREGFALKVWIVSPTTCMAVLNTMRAVLKDARMREQAGAIRKALGALARDMDLVIDRVGRVETHFAQARADLDGIASAAGRAGRRAQQLDSFDFGEGDKVRIVREGERA